MIFEVCENVEAFFEILPIDWKESILPYWDDLKSSTACYVILEKNKIIAGGLLFTVCTPDMLYAKVEAENWLKKGYKYLGFIYVVENRRHESLGSLWLNSLKEFLPEQKFWLTIEDKNLDTFYLKNGFKCIKHLINHGEKEWIYTN